MEGDSKKVQELLNAGADPNSRLKSCGNTPLHVAAINGRDAVVQMLVEAGADLEAVDKSNGRTPLHVAAYDGNEAMVKMLVEAGANFKAVDKYRNCPADITNAAAIKKLLQAEG